MRLASAILAAIAFITPSPAIAAPHTPRLIAFECKGASGPLYADEEDELPPCKRIERNR